MNNIQYDSVSDVVGWQLRLRWTVTPGNDLFVVYTHNWLDDPVLGSADGDDDGYGVSIGYREVNHTPLEFRLSIDHIALNDADTSDTTMDVSFQYELSNRFKILGGIQFGGDENIFRAGVRYYLQTGE